MIGMLFSFFVVVALAAIGAIEWFKALIKALGQPKGQKAQAVGISLLSLLACLVAGDAAVLGGLFITYHLAGFAAGLLVGFIALGFVELAYQLIVQLFLEAAKRLIRLLRGDEGAIVAVEEVHSGEAASAVGAGSVEEGEGSPAGVKDTPIGFYAGEDPDREEPGIPAQAGGLS